MREGVTSLHLAAPSPFAYTHTMPTQKPELVINTDAAISSPEDWLFQALVSTLNDDAVQDMMVHEIVGVIEQVKFQYLLNQCLED